MRFFNTAGPVNSADHYCLPPLERFDLGELLALIGQKKYFILHAPRQTGKTSSLLALMAHLNQGGQYRCVYTNVEAAQAARFLQRIVNGGGRIEREYGLGRKRTDLLLIRPYDKGVQKTVIELKVLHRSPERTIAEGLEQTWEYLDRSGAEEGHLVVFDRTPDKPWTEKRFRREETVRDVPMTVWGT